MRHIRSILVLLLLALLLSASAAAAAADDAIVLLTQAVAGGSTEFSVSLAKEDSAVAVQDAIEAYLLEQQDWPHVSPHVSSKYRDGSVEGHGVLDVHLRYAGRDGYEDALTAAYDACIRSGMAPLEKAMSVYSYLAGAVQYTTASGCDTACDALLRGTADSYGFAAAARALLQKAGVPCRVSAGSYRRSDHAWDLVEFEDAWYLFDASRGGWEGVPGRVDYDYLLLGTASASSLGYSHLSEAAEQDYGLPFLARSSISTPLMLQDDGLWFIQQNRLYCAPYGSGFRRDSESVRGTLFEAGSHVIYSAVMAEGAVYFSADQLAPGLTACALYSYVPGMTAPEVRSTGLGVPFGLERKDGALVLTGDHTETASLRQYTDVTKDAFFAWDAGLTAAELPGGDLRLLGQTDGVQIFAAFYRKDGQLLDVVLAGAGSAFSVGAPPQDCRRVQLFAVGADCCPVSGKLTLTAP